MACFDNANPTLQYKSFEQRYATILMSVGTEQPFLVSIQAWFFYILLCIYLLSSCFLSKYFSS